MVGLGLFFDEAVGGMEIVHIVSQVVEHGGVDGAFEAELFDQALLPLYHFMEGKAQDFEEVVLLDVLVDDLLAGHRFYLGISL